MNLLSYTSWRNPANKISRKKVRLMVELEPVKYEINSYTEPLVEMRDSL